MVWRHWLQNNCCLSTETRHDGKPSVALWKCLRYESSFSFPVDLPRMSDGRQTPENGGPDQGPPGSAMPSVDNEGAKKPAGMMKPAFDDGALKVMEDEFQVRLARLAVLFSPSLFRLFSMNSSVAIEAWTSFVPNTKNCTRLSWNRMIARNAWCRNAANWMRN